MLKRSYGPGNSMAANVVDRLDSNLSVKCFGCDGVFMVSTKVFLTRAATGAHRRCPHCHQTAAMANFLGDGAIIWINEDRRSNRA